MNRNSKVNMNNRKITCIIIPHYRDRVYSKRFSLASVKILLGIAGFFLLLILFTILLVLQFYHQLYKLNYLTKRNQYLELENRRVRELQKRLAKIESEGNKFKRMLGADKTPPEPNWEFGIGGSEPSLAKRRLQSGLIKAQGSPAILKIPPVQNYLISQEFDSLHPALDFAVTLRSPVFAPNDGIIKEIGEDSIMGIYLLISHSDDYETFYGHLYKTNRTVNEKVKTGEIIGYAGSTGRSASPHLHFELRYKGKKVNPTVFLK